MCIDELVSTDGVLIVVTNKRSRKRAWSDTELNEKLNQQIHFVRSSCKAIDAGIEFESLRLASTLRTLLNDTKSSHGSGQNVGMLQQLGIRDSIQWLDQSVSNQRFISIWNDGILTEVEIEGRTESGEIVHPDFSSMDGLVAIGKIGDGFGYIPLFHLPTSPEKYVDFDDWWKAILVRSPQGTVLSRQGIVRSLANYEGGSHLDPSGLDERYKTYRQQGHDLFWSNDAPELLSNDGEWQRPSGDIISVSIRQIAHEFLVSLSKAEII